MTDSFTRSTFYAGEVTVKLNRTGVVEKVRKVMEGRMMRAGNYLKNKTIQNISVPGTLRVVVGTSRKGRPIYRKIIQHSRPGEYPHAITRVLKRSIFRDPVVQTKGGLFVKVRVGAQAFYGKILELTTRSNGRPFLRRTLKEERRAIYDILLGRQSGAAESGGDGGQGYVPPRSVREGARSRAGGESRASYSMATSAEKARIRAANQTVSTREGDRGTGESREDFLGESRGEAAGAARGRMSRARADRSRGGGRTRQGKRKRIIPGSMLTLQKYLELKANARRRR